MFDAKVNPKSTKPEEFTGANVIVSATVPVTPAASVGQFPVDDFRNPVEVRTPNVSDIVPPAVTPLTPEAVTPSIRKPLRAEKSNMSAPPLFSEAKE